MVERRIQDFATVDTAYDDDLLLIAPAAEDANSRETYNVTVKTLELAIQGDAHQAVEDAQNALEQTRQLAAQAKTNAESAAESKENAASSVTTIRDLYKQTSREADRAKSEADRAAAAVSTDKTLSMDGAPADAKAVGEALENLKLTPATATILGGVKVGDGLTVTEDGTLRAKGYSKDEIDSKLKRLERMMNMDGKLVFSGAGVCTGGTTTMTIPSTVDYVEIVSAIPAMGRNNRGYTDGADYMAAIGTTLGVSADFGHAKVARGGSAAVAFTGLTTSGNKKLGNDFPEKNIYFNNESADVSLVSVSFASGGTLSISGGSSSNRFTVYGYQYL